MSYDVPVDMRKYVHRVGRTARAGREGDAWTLVEEQEVRICSLHPWSNLGVDEWSFIIFLSLGGLLGNHFSRLRLLMTPIYRAGRFQTSGALFQGDAAGSGACGRREEGAGI